MDDELRRRWSCAVLSGKAVPPGGPNTVTEQNHSSMHKSMQYALEGQSEGGRIVVGNIWCWRTEFTSRKGRILGIPVRLTSPSFARRLRLLNVVFSMKGALRGCRAVKFDSCKNFLSFVHTVLVNILRSVRA